MFKLTYQRTSTDCIEAEWWFYRFGWNYFAFTRVPVTEIVLKQILKFIFEFINYCVALRLMVKILDLEKEEFRELNFDFLREKLVFLRKIKGEKPRFRF